MSIHYDVEILDKSTFDDAIEIFNKYDVDYCGTRINEFSPLNSLSCLTDDSQVYQSIKNDLERSGILFYVEETEFEET